MVRFLPEGVTLGVFKPHSRECKAMDDIFVITEDISLVTKWYGLVSIQHMCSDDGIKGFQLMSAKQLRGVLQIKFVPLLLFQAFWLDCRSDQHTYSFRGLCRLYAGPAKLLLYYPTTWWLSKD